MTNAGAWFANVAGMDKVDRRVWFHVVKLYNSVTLLLNCNKDGDHHCDVEDFRMILTQVARVEVTN